MATNGAKIKEGVVVDGKRIREGEVTFPDFENRPVRVGSIVEIIERANDRYRGLYYVVGMEAGGGARGIRFLLARCRFDKWDFKAGPMRVMLKAY